MTLDEYIAQLVLIRNQFPEAGKLPLVYSKDSEGNYYEQVIYTPSPGLFEENGEFTPISTEAQAKKTSELLGVEVKPNNKYNAICIN